MTDNNQLPANAPLAERSFDELSLSPAMRAALKQLGYQSMTPIQAASLPITLAGHDLIAQAKTGSGKTAAFAITVLTNLNPRWFAVQAMVLCPTRELADQVTQEIRRLARFEDNIKVLALCGGTTMRPQMASLEHGAHIVVGTPGRIIDHLQRGSLMLHDATYLVLDETDRMLDMGFEDQIMQVLKYLPQQRQTLLFSATLPPAILKLSEKYLRNPIRVEVGETNKVADRIDNKSVNVTNEEKYNLLVKELKERTGTAIIFVKAKYGTEKLAAKLKKSGFTADAIHGDLEQRQRERVLNAFREQKHRILVATDIASRGLDIPHIEHVINYDLPQAPEDYIHRLGRTARAGADGAAISFIAPEDALKWRAIQKLLNPDAKFEPLPAGTPGMKKRSRGGRNRRPGGGNGGQGGGNRHSGAPRAAAN